MNIDLPPEAFVRGRVYGHQWSLENVARLLRFHASRGFLTGRDLRADAEYRLKCSARHIATECSVIFTRDNVIEPGVGAVRGWHASICFIGENCYRPWNDEIADRWLAALFLEDRPGVAERGLLTEIGRAKGVRHFFVEVPQWD